MPTANNCSSGASLSRDVHIDDLIILSVLQFSDVYVDSSPIEVQHDDLQMLTNAGKSGSTLKGEFWRGRLERVAGTRGFPLERRVSLMLTCRRKSDSLAGPPGRAFVLAFRREVFAGLGVSYTAATTLPPSRRRVNGALLDELALVTGPEEKGKHLRLDWKGEEPPSNMQDVRAAAAPLALRSKWTTLFSFCFF